MDDGIPSVSHTPAVIEGLIFPTTPLVRTYEEIRVPVHLRTSGSWFSGASGQGKSTALEYCVEALKSEFPDLVVFALNHHMLPGNASRSIPLRLLDAIDGKAVGDATRLRLRLVRLLAELCYGTAARQCVLFFDEAQALRPQDLFFLKDLSNDLARHNTGMLTFMFGESPKMDQLVGKSRSGEDLGLAERFFVRRLCLHGYDALSDWRSLLMQMDEVDFSILGGKTVPQYFLCNPVGTPYQMQSQVNALWEAFQPRGGHDPLPTLRRKFTAIRWWILQAGPYIRRHEEIPDGLWRRSVEYAAFGGD